MHTRHRGSTLLEVLVAIVIAAFGVLGFVGLMSKSLLGEVESYSRAQASMLLSDMAERLSANRNAAAAYTTSGTIGTGDSQPADCTTTTPTAARDICEWSNALKGAAETKSSANVGAMLGARGCIEQIQVPNQTPGTCTPGIYRVTVVWQGLHLTKAPPINCGTITSTSTVWGDAKYGRSASLRVVVGLPSCN